MLEVKANNYVAIGDKVREYTKPIETCSWETSMLTYKPKSQYTVEDRWRRCTTYENIKLWFWCLGKLYWRTWICAQSTFGNIVIPEDQTAPHYQILMGLAYLLMEARVIEENAPVFPIKIRPFLVLVYVQPGIVRQQDPLAGCWMPWFNKAGDTSIVNQFVKLERKRWLQKKLFILSYSNGALFEIVFLLKIFLCILKYDNCEIH